MGNHKNHGNRQHVKGFRPGHAPVHVPTQHQISYKIGIDADSTHVVIEFNRAVDNLQMPPSAVDELIQNLRNAKAVLLTKQAEKVQG